MKELEKTYNPADIEDRLYQEMAGQQIFPRRCRARTQKRQEAVHDCDAAAKYYRTASYGTCAG